MKIEIKRKRMMNIHGDSVGVGGKVGGTVGGVVGAKVGARVALGGGVGASVGARVGISVEASTRLEKQKEKEITNRSIKKIKIIFTIHTGNGTRTTRECNDGGRLNDVVAVDCIVGSIPATDIYLYQK